MDQIYPKKCICSLRQKTKTTPSNSVYSNYYRYNFDSLDQTCGKIFFAEDKIDLTNNVIDEKKLSDIEDILMSLQRFVNPLMPGGNKKVTHT